MGKYVIMIEGSCFGGEGYCAGILSEAVKGLEAEFSQ